MTLGWKCLQDLAQNVLSQVYCTQSLLCFSCKFTLFLAKMPVSHYDMHLTYCTFEQSISARRCRESVEPLPVHYRALHPSGNQVTLETWYFREIMQNCVTKSCAKLCKEGTTRNLHSHTLLHKILQTLQPRILLVSLLLAWNVKARLQVCLAAMAAAQAHSPVRLKPTLLSVVTYLRHQW